jgi:hypothetical protein
MPSALANLIAPADVSFSSSPSSAGRRRSARPPPDDRELGQEQAVLTVLMSRAFLFTWVLGFKGGMLVPAETSGLGSSC